MRKPLIHTAVAIGALLGVGVALSGQSSSMPMADKAMVDKYLAGWKARPREVAQKMIGKYGQPQEATPQRLIWHNNRPWKVTELVDEEIPHDFPMPHHDMLYQAIAYRVADSDKVESLFQYDGSVIVERTKGELAARCDKEEANFLAINLAHDIVTGKRNVEDARKFYADSIMAMMKGKPGEYLEGFRFQLPQGSQGDRDKPTMSAMPAAK
jgi:hypothetical protein